MSTGAWFDPEDSSIPGPECKHGNPNALMLDRGTSRLAQSSPVAHTCLVEIERFAGAPQRVTAHVPPEIIRNRERVIPDE